MKALRAASLALLAWAAAAGAATPGEWGLSAPAYTLRDAWLAQRTIERQWGPSDDSTYRVVDVPGWRSEGAALVMSAVVPGSGQLYVGEGSGWWFLLAEAAGLTGHYFSNRLAGRYADDAAAFSGDPNDSLANFSFARYQYWTRGDVAYLRRLWEGDREEFYRVLMSDPTYLAGWAGARPEETFTSWYDLRKRRDESLHRSRLIETFLWVQHLAAAVDAFRAARFHNLPLRQQYQLQLGQNWQHGRPVLRAALVRRF